MSRRRPLALAFLLFLAGSGQAGPPREDRLVYRMIAGDTLYSLARWSRVRLPALLAANPGIDPHRIEIGDEIRLPPGAMPPGPARFRERGNGPGPAAERPRPPSREMRLPPPRPRELRQAPPPRELRRAPPPPPATDKPDEEDEREPEGM